MGVTVNKYEFIPLIAQLGGYLKAAMDEYADLRAAGSKADPDAIAFFLEAKLAGWEPKLSGKALLDPATRAACARFLAGVAVNFVSG